MKLFASLVLVAGCTNVAPDEPPAEGDGKADGGLPVLANGVARHGLAAPWGDALEFRIDVPAGATSLLVTTRGGIGDADLYLRRGLRVDGGGSRPYDFRSATWASDENIAVDEPAFDRWYVLVHAATSFQDVTLTATADAPPIDSESEPNDEFAQADALAGPGSIRGRLDAEHEIDVFRIEASGRLALELDTPPGADFELTLWDANEDVVGSADSGVIGEPETLRVELGPQPAVYFIAVEPYLDNVSASSYTLSADW